MADYLFAVAWKIVDDRNLNHRVGTGLLLHRGTGSIDEHLSSEGRIVNFHVELKELIVRLSAHALTNEVHAMTDIVQGIHALHLEDMRLIICKIGVSLDGLRAPSSNST